MYSCAHTRQQEQQQQHSDEASQLGDRSLSKAMISPRLPHTHTLPSQTDTDTKPRTGTDTVKPRQNSQGSAAKRSKPYFLIPPTVGRRIESQKKNASQPEGNYRLIS